MVGEGEDGRLGWGEVSFSSSFSGMDDNSGRRYRVFGELGTVLLAE